MLLGHSWGAVLALEYALRHPGRVARMILLNPAPASAADLDDFRRSRRERHPEDVARLDAISASPGYEDGDPAAVTAYYAVHFKAALARPGDLDKLIARLSASFTREGILEARAIEDRLVAETWAVPGYDLLPKLGTLRIPALVIHGDHDIIPGDASAHIARALPHGRVVTLND